MACGIPPMLVTPVWFAALGVFVWMQPNSPEPKDIWLLSLLTITIYLDKEKYQILTI